MYCNKNKRKCKYQYLLLFIAVLAMAIFLRFYNLGGQPYWMDEGYTINAVLSISAHGNTILDSGQNYFCPMYCYPTAWIAGVLGQNAIAYRLFSAIMGILLILAVYLIMKKLFSRHVALLASFFAAFSYWQIAWSRQARWYTLLALLFWLAIYFFYEFLQADSRKKRIWYLIAALAISVLAILAHQIAYLLVPIFIILLLLQVYSERKNIRISLKLIIIAVVCLLVAILIPEWILNFGITRSMIAKFGLFYELPYYLSFYLANYWLFIFLAVYAYFGAPRGQKLRYALFILPFLVYLTAFSFFTNIVHYRYLFAPALGLYLLGAIGAIDIFSKLWQKYRVIAVVFLLAVIGIFFATGQGVWRPLPFYTLESDIGFRQRGERPYWSYTPQPNFNGAYQAVVDNLKPGEIIISSHPQFNKIFLHQPGYWIKYNYLGFENKPETITNDREYYGGAKVIDDLAELKQFVSSTHGYIVFDQMSITGRIPPEIVDYIRNSMKQIYFNEINEYSRIWVYKF